MSSSSSSPSSDSDDEEKTAGKISKWKFVRTTMGRILEMQFDECDADDFVDLLSSPSVKTLTVLKKKLKKSDRDWIHEFLDGAGLGILLDAVDVIGSRRVTKLSEALKLFQCVSCIKLLVNSLTGLSFFVQHSSHIKKLVKGKWGFNL